MGVSKVAGCSTEAFGHDDQGQSRWIPAFAGMTVKVKIKVAGFPTQAFGNDGKHYLSAYCLIFNYIVTLYASPFLWQRDYVCLIVNYS